MPKLLGLYYDPYIALENRFVHEKYGWTAPNAGIVTACDQLNGVLPDELKYTLTLRAIDLPGVSRLAFNASHIDLIDTTEPQFYTVDEWINLWNTLGFNPNMWPKGGQIHVKNFIQKNNIVELINSGTIDELWTGGVPIPEAFEGAMLAPVDDMDAYRTHDRVIYIPGLQRRCVWHMFQISNWNPLHNYWHRIEAIMAHIWGTYGYGYDEQWSPPQDMANVRHYWQLFSLTDNTRPGEAQVGTCHFMPNSKLGYVYDMDDVVPSGASLWREWPNGFPLDLNRTDRFDLINKDMWDHLPDYVWQFMHIPGAMGTYAQEQANLMVDGRYANWWKYIVNVNDMTGKDEPWTRPWVGTQVYSVNAVTKYNEQALVRWEPRADDPEDALYTVNGREFRRRGAAHVKFSTAVPIADKYTIRLQDGWTITYDINVPMPTPTPSGTVLTLQEVYKAIDEVHISLATNCPKPDSVVLGTGVWNLKWNDIEGGTTVGISIYLNANLFKIAYENAAKGVCAKVPVPVPTPTPVPVPVPIPIAIELANQYNAVHQAMKNMQDNGVPAPISVQTLDQILRERLTDAAGN